MKQLATQSAAMDATFTLLDLLQQRKPVASASG